MNKSPADSVFFNPVEIIRKKRDGLALSDSEISAFIHAATHQKVPEYQVTAFLMATYFMGMEPRETAALTQAMIDSGNQVRFSSGPPAVQLVDKHSTGGLGDKISIILAPLVACLGVKVPMVAGRGLGHTGGTLDKLESIPGFRVDLPLDRFHSQVEKLGAAIMGQTEDFVPADKLLYGLRDVTATVDCIPLITASILSKKVSEGISGLVLDIKVGSGAFMKNMTEAQSLAKSMLKVGKHLKLRIRAVLTDMNQPLGYTIGNSLEILECLDIMQGKVITPELTGNGLAQDIRDLTIELAAHMIVLAHQASSLSAARIIARRTLQDGSALKMFQTLCEAQGISVPFEEIRSNLHVAKDSVDVFAHRSGYVSQIDGETLGKIVIDLGGGRHQASDNVNHSVGIVLKAKVGTALKKGAPLMRIYYKKELTPTIDDILMRATKAFSISAKKPRALPLIKKVLS